MTIAGFVNLAMMATAAAAFHFSGHTGIADLDQAYLTLEPLLSHAAATVFGLSPGGCGTLFYRGRYAGGAGGDARVYPFSHSAMGTPYRHHDAIIYCDSDGIGSDPYSGDESGVAQFWYRAGAGAAADLHQRQSADGDLVNRRCVKQIGWVIVILVVALNLWLLAGTAMGL